MKEFLGAGVVIGIVFLLLLISPFLTIWGLNTLLGLGISHGVWEYLAVWALILVWGPKERVTTKT